MTKKDTTPSAVPETALLSATAAAKLLGLGRTRFWQLRQQFNLQKVSWSPATRPLYRYEDVMALRMPQGADRMEAATVPIISETSLASAPAQASPTGDAEERLARARAKFITSFAHLPELPDFPSDKVLLEQYGG